MSNANKINELNVLEENSTDSDSIKQNFTFLELNFNPFFIQSFLTNSTNFFTFNSTCISVV